ncbi:MAG: response regulator [Desulfatibacillum sp.]|nr:response regulator [Desulfatibacillum sp.]
MNEQGAGKILLMEKDSSHSDSLLDRLGQLGYRTDVAHSCDEARLAMGKEDYSVVIACAELPDWGGPQGVNSLGRGRKRPTMLVTCDQDSRESAIRCIQKGAYDYLPRQCESSRLEITLERAFAEHCLAAKTRRLKRMTWGIAFSTPIWIGLGMGLAHAIA